MHKDPSARIAQKERWGDYFLLSLESRSIASTAQPGQFIMVRVTSQDFPLLRRPFSIHARGQNTLDIFFQTAGLGTSLLSQKTVGDSLDILGPLGRGFTIEGDFDGRDVALIGGGRGIAPLFLLAEELKLRGASVRIFYGGKTQNDLPLRERFQRRGFPTSCSTDDGSFGFQGQITELFEAETEKRIPHSIYACGPEAMLERIGELCQKQEVSAEFSLESIMGCGFGACWGCVKKIRGEDGAAWQKICERGPVFSAGEIIWPGKEK